MTPIPAAAPLSPPPAAPTLKGRQHADRFEAAFLEQMMKYMGPQARQGAGSGGEGEAQFQSFLTQEYARVLAGRLDLHLTPRGTR